MGWALVLPRTVGLGAGVEANPELGKLRWPYERGREANLNMGCGTGITSCNLPSFSVCC